MRYNMFNQIHKALRVLLYDTGVLISQTDFDNPLQADMVAERLNQLLDLFINHADNEDRMVLPLLQEYEPGVVSAFEQEHVTDHALVQQLKGFLMALAYSISSEAKTELGASLTTAYIEFMIFNLQHMQKEETVLNKMLWQYYSDEELAEINQKIVSSIPVDEVALASHWMMKALSDREITAWLRSVERHAPPPVFRSLSAIAEKELDKNRYHVIVEGLSRGILTA